MRPVRHVDVDKDSCIVKCSIDSPVGMAADRAGLKEGDELVSVNKQDVSSLTHEGLVSMIKQVRER